MPALHNQSYERKKEVAKEKIIRESHFLLVHSFPLIDQAEGGRQAQAQAALSSQQ